MRTRTAVTGIVAALVGSAAGSASAEPNVRVQVTQRGDFVLIGNTFAQDCGPGVPGPTVGNVGTCGNNTNDSAPDVYWRADQPMDGQATANTSITSSMARTTAVLNIPTGATITNAYLYWAGRSPTATPNGTIKVDRPGVFTEQTVNAIDLVNGVGMYQAVADVTSLVQTNGAGAYRVSGPDVISLSGLSDTTVATGWWMVVMYELPTEPPRNLTLFDGLDQVTDGTSVTATLSGFKVPTSGYNAKLGVIAYDGDDQTTGDSLLWNGTKLTNALNPADNFFNSTRSSLGAAATAAGDLPQLTGGARSMSGIDIDVLDVTMNTPGGSTSADIEAAMVTDSYFVGGFITSISTLKPDLSSSSKNVTDVNGGFLNPGDELEYTIVVTNKGDDATKDTVLIDKLPPEVTYKPGTITITSGANAGPKTDAAADDQGEFDPAAGSVVVRLGTGANGTNGGSLAIGETTTVKFSVIVKAESDGAIENQATIDASGAQGSPPETTPTDGNGNDAGTPPTVVLVDSDGDGLSNQDETANGTNPNDADSDDDGVIDGAEMFWNADSDGDGLINALDPDSDNDGLLDGTEMGLDCSNPATDTSKKSCIADADGGATTTDPLSWDTDGGGKSDGSEDYNRDGKVDPGEGNPLDGSDDSTIVDSDGDGLSDGLEQTIGTNPNDADSDDDGVIDGNEPNPAIDSDGDGLINSLDADSDNDALFDGTELGLDCTNPSTDPAAKSCIADADQGATKTSPLDRDTDGGGVSDGSEDKNRNGQIDPGETDPLIGADDSTVIDTDGDGLSDELEQTIGTNPNDADSDDDGVPDGQEPNPTEDTDGDGLINPLDPDSDNDGLLDGTEMGYGCNGAGTVAANCVPDADMGATKTSPLDPDTDDGGVPDGSEDANLDGKIDSGEGDPNNPADDAAIVDSDGDGLSDSLEGFLGTDPKDADSDDDGVIDGQEPNFSYDSDGDGVINALDVDSDNDGLFDGTELGLGCENPATDNTKKHCVPDADMGATKTSPIDPDTDDGGKSDGSEDFNLNGQVDPGEGNPLDPSDDSSIDDMDGDGLSDGLENTLGSDPNDADSDDDGVLDGQEANPSDDSDGDSKKNVLDPDSDNDGLFDGTEMGKDCSNPATNQAAGTCKPDADKGATQTSPIDADTDDGGVSDGDEDKNKNGVVDGGETNPNDGSDDQPPCTTDADCGSATSGKVCDSTNTCVDGCRGQDGNGCPSGETCSSTDATIGTCMTPSSSSTGSGGAGGEGGSNNPDDYRVSGGCAGCSVPAEEEAPRGMLAILGVAIAAFIRRRRNK